jgi:hypothetical protein
MTKKRTQTAEVDVAVKLRHLRELIAALDRRVPHVERAGELAIARDSAALRKKALQRIAVLDGKTEAIETDLRPGGRAPL